nr:cysteine desulfurase-like protein ustd [Quercus suber]
MPVDVTQIRKHFPALQQKQVYFDNAGGSQVLQEVIDSITNYLASSNVQLGASYPVSQTSTKLFDDGSSAVAKYINASPEEVVLGPSTTQLFRNLSAALYDYITPESEIIVSLLDHEANIASWVQLAAWKKCTLRWWGASSSKTSNPRLDCASLRQLMTPRTRLVACTHASNILGTIHDVQALAQTVHEVPGALLCVDAVAYAPHRAIDVRAWGVDVYCFSWYKLYGPHIASMYVSKAAQQHLHTLGHFFKPTDSLGNLLGLAAASYELVASVPAVCEYLRSVPWNEIALHEEKLAAVLIDYLNSKPHIFQIVGEPVADKAKRVPVMSFTVAGKTSREVVEAVEAKSDFGCRWGTFYSVRLAEQVIGLDPEDGVVRVSLVHYNTGKTKFPTFGSSNVYWLTTLTIRGRNPRICESSRLHHLSMSVESICKPRFCFVISTEERFS